MENSLQEPESLQRIILISYDGKLTGSLELRKDNERIFKLLDKSYTEEPGSLTEIGKYAHEYDKSDKIGGANKVGEPYYDGFLVGIASLSDTHFNESFEYLQTILNDKPLEYTDKVVEWKDSMLCTDIVLGEDNQPKTNTRNQLNYSDAVHIYIMGPASESCLKNINRIKDAYPNKTIIIHIQGEANSSLPNLKTTNYSASSMTAKQGMFPVAFNLWTGEKEMFKIRALCNESYTVGVKDLKLAPSTIPPIYNSIVDHILSTILLIPTGPGFIDMCTPLDNVLVCQDTFDKDNLVSMAMVIQNTSNICKFNIISRRIYVPDCDQYPVFNIPPNKELIDKAQMLENEKGPGAPSGFMRCCNDKEWQSPVTIHKRINVFSDEYKNNTNGIKVDAIRDMQLSGKQQFNRRLTIRSLMILYENVQRILNEWMEYNPAFSKKINFIRPTIYDVTDSIEPISASRRCPFPEKMFTYINYWKDIFELESILTSMNEELERYKTLLREKSVS